MKFTFDAIRRLTLPLGKTDAIFFDDDIAGFGLRLRAKGSKTWIVQYTIGAKQRRMTLGSSKVLDLAKARDIARDVLAKVRLGQDPAGERAQARIQASDASLGDLLKRFLSRQEKRLRPSSYRDSCRYLEVHLRPLHRLHLGHISRATIAVQLDAIANKRGPVAADRARAAFSAFFTWAIASGLCEANPVIGTN